ncbi:hypothetical protein V8F20_010141 [Naviculisporaceae sp. PSN 640]
MSLTKEEAWKASESGVVVDMKSLTGLDQNVERVDIDVLLTEHPDTFNLFLQALDDMQNDKPESIVGYFQLAGIHGYPSGVWDNNGRAVSSKTWDDNPKGFDPNRFGGYCAHGVLTFGPWHRPYLALLEQTLYRRMVNIANKYTDSAVKARYLNAAQKFRLPYWDYYRARGPGFTVTRQEIRNKDLRDANDWDLRAPPAEFPYDFRLPDIFMTKTVTIRSHPNNEPKSLDNPLYSYKFKGERGGLKARDLRELEGSYSAKMTIRCPPPNGGRTADSHGVDQLRYNLNVNVQSGVSLLIDMMKDTKYRRFDAVGSDQLVRGDFAPSGSLEGSIHGQYHNLIGYGGVMDNPRFAAFDPVFWFHHCNIDRYFALWQAANPLTPDHPERWFPRPQPGTNQTYDGDKPLWPFYKTRRGPGDGTYWTPDTCRETTTLGYVYDDFTRMKTMNPPPRSVGDYVRNRYSFATRKPNSSGLGEATLRILDSQVKSSFFFKEPQELADEGGPFLMAMMPQAPPVAAPMALNPIADVFDRDWYVDSKVKRMAANDTFTIYFFISPHGALPDNEPHEYASSPYLVGMHHVFAAPVGECSNCADADAAGRLSVDTTPITPRLLFYREDVEGNGVESLRPEHIKPFLVKYLRWRVVFHGFNLESTRNPDLELKIGVSAKVYHDNGEPTYEDYPDVVDAIIANAK